MARTTILSRTTAALAALAAACAGGGGGTAEVKSPYAAPTETTTTTFDARHPFRGTGPAYSWIGGERIVMGKPYRDYRVGFGSRDDGKGISVLVDDLGDGRYAFIGFDEKSILTVQGDKPYVVDTGVPPGEAQVVDVSATTWTADDPTPRPGNARVEYVKVSDDAVVATSGGDIGGVKHFTGTVEMDGEGVPEILRGFPIEMSVWWHPSLGIVKSEVPIFNAGVDLRGQSDCGDPLDPGFNTIQAMGIVAPGGPAFELGTAGCSGQWNADKMTHAKMLLELRFADEELAKTATRPPVIEEFTTGWGYFPHQLVASPLSIFHPEENGKGYTFWYGYADEAAKNEPGDNGIQYVIEARPADYMTNAVRATARIRYNVIAMP